MDGNFCHVALENKIHIREQLPKVLGGNCKELVTPCVLEELRSLGETFRGALMIAKRFEVRSCGHQDHLKVAHECLASLVEQNNNPNHYIVATQDVQLRKRLRHYPAIPLLYVHYNVMIMEPPGGASKDAARLIDQTKLTPKEHERRFIEHLRNQEIKNMPEASAPISKRKFTRKRKAKAPNPLSVLKKRKKPIPKTPNKSTQ